MKKYIEPKIKCVALDADQAILNVCAVFQGAGAWIGAVGVCYYNSTGGSGFFLSNERCTLGLRGYLNDDTARTSSSTNPDSPGS